MNYFYKFLCVLLIVAFSACTNTTVEQPHIVFVIGDEEYRSEESMPMLAHIAKRELNAKVTLCYSVDSLGYIDPNRTDHIQGLEALETADLMVMFTRFRDLPDTELQHILSYAESGKPMVGFRTTTHAFLYKNDSTKTYMNNDWPTKVFGQQWITHHGHFDDGERPLTAINISKEAHPVAKNIQPFDAYSWLYHVDGGDWKLYGDSDPFLEGTSLKSGHQQNNRLDKFPMTNPVAWTKSYAGKNGISRVFFTTLGHPYDWKNENMRRLALNGIYWALGKDIPNELNVDFATTYNPNNSGFGTKYKQGKLPLVIE